VKDILQQIVADKRPEVEALKLNTPLETIEREIPAIERLDFRAVIDTGDVGIIAEIKRGSPSRGILSADFNPMVLAGRYADGGAVALSVLTEQNYFFGHYEFMELAKRRSGLPILCKDFVFDTYQIYYARYRHADAILLIVRLLSPPTLREFIGVARSIGLDCLVETHNREEVQIALDCGADIIGVNNRDLVDFTVNLETAEELAGLIPNSISKVAESGIHTPADIERLRKSGYLTFLIGEALVTSSDPVTLLKSLRGA